MDSWWTMMVISAAALVLGTGIIGSFALLRRMWVKSSLEREGMRVESEQKFTAFFNTVSDCIYIHAPDGKILEVNESAASLFEKSCDEMVGSTLTAVLGPRYFRELNRYLARMRDRREIVRGVVSLVFRNPRRLILLDYQSTPLIKDGELVAVQGIARDVTEQKLSERSLRRSEARLKVILDRATAMQRNLELVSREMMRVQEEERVKISRELHDEIGQLLATIRLNLKLMKNVSGDNGGSGTIVNRKLGETEQLAGEMFDRIRRFLKELRPMGLDEHGLLAAVRQLKNSCAEREGFTATLTGDLQALDRFSGEKRTIVYRIIQEGLTNISKHAQASDVSIEIVDQEGGVGVRVSDNGIGFDVEGYTGATGHAGGIGLMGMRERIKLIGGDFRIVSKPGAGTRVEVSIPKDG